MARFIFFVLLIFSKEAATDSELRRFSLHGVGPKATSNQVPDNPQPHQLQVPFQWLSARKSAIATPFEPTGAFAPVWVTTTENVISEIFYPNLNEAQIGFVEFLVTDGSGFISTQRKSTVSNVRYLDEGMAIQISGNDLNLAYDYFQTIVIDPQRPVVRIHLKFRWYRQNLRPVIIVQPTLHNQSSHDVAYTAPHALFASPDPQEYPLDFFQDHPMKKRGVHPQPRHLAIVQRVPWLHAGASFHGQANDQDFLSRFLEKESQWNHLGPGHVQLFGELTNLSAKTIGQSITSDAMISEYEFAVGFGPSQYSAFLAARTSIENLSFSQVQENYERSWISFLNQFNHREIQVGMQSESPQVFQFTAESLAARRSLQILKMHEDKSHRGAIVAALSKSEKEQNSPSQLVWPRILVTVASALLASGDFQTPLAVLTFLQETQNSDGSWAKNFLVDGTPFDITVETDQICYPIILAGLIRKHSKIKLTSFQIEMIRKALQRLVIRGPNISEDRWGTLSSGFSPASLALFVAALRTATFISGDRSESQSLKDQIDIQNMTERWQSLIEKWTLQFSEIHENTFYPRFQMSNGGESESAQALKNALQPVKPLMNFSGIVDLSFLQLVRYGIRESDDPRVLQTLKLIETLPILAPEASILFHHYFKKYSLTEDEVWPILNAERGHFAVLSKDKNQALSELARIESLMMLDQGNGMLPEKLAFTSPQKDALELHVREQFLRPWVLSHAEYILLHRNIEVNEVFDHELWKTPDP